MIVDLKVHVNVEIVHYKSRQRSNMRPPRKFFLSSTKDFVGRKILIWDLRER